MGWGARCSAASRWQALRCSRCVRHVLGRHFRCCGRRECAAGVRILDDAGVHDGARGSPCGCVVALSNTLTVPGLVCDVGARHWGGGERPMCRARDVRPRAGSSCRAPLAGTWPRPEHHDLRPVAGDADGRGAGGVAGRGPRGRGGAVAAAGRPRHDNTYLGRAPTTLRGRSSCAMTALCAGRRRRRPLSPRRRKRASRLSLRIP